MCTYSWKVFLTIEMWVSASLLQLILGSPDANRLYGDLMRDYNKLIRPVVRNTDILTVFFGIKFIQLINVVLGQHISLLELFKLRILFLLIMKLLKSYSTRVSSNAGRQASDSDQVNIVVSGRGQPSYHNKRDRSPGSSIPTHSKPSQENFLR
ncbi:hypothetical protein RvY_03018-2 [Ramazzottius varieornatus]|uniref:Neurotransmitter-gated ion-channel ligand-binding domain-containing protein n=1 Tax=Ramazzottius varieornatus TaxID=947166 RepID=A0A1D1ULM0_RAMVA|nr:hypothetical protein RvY_03018-2 [Ramazzottius varieornatus]